MTANFNLKNKIFNNIIISSNVIKSKARNVAIIVFSAFVA